MIFKIFDKNTVLVKGKYMKKQKPISIVFIGDIRSSEEIKI